jgi:hypothetical protein
MLAGVLLMAKQHQLKQARYLLGLTLIVTLGCGLAQHWDGNQVQEIRLGEVVLDTTW